MDEAILRSVNGLSTNPVWAALGVALSSRWMLLIVGAPIIGVLSMQRRFLALLAIVFATATADLTSSRVIKPAFDRERPCRVLPALVTPDGCGPGRSFPSSHAATSFALATASSMLIRNAFPILFVAAAVSASRVLVGVHYPSDVLGGALWGLAIGMIFAWRTKKYEAQKSQSS